MVEGELFFDWTFGKKTLSEKVKFRYKFDENKAEIVNYLTEFHILKSMCDYQEIKEHFENANFLDGGFKNFVNDLNRDSKTICRANSRENWTKICKFNYEKAQWLKNCCSDNLETALKGMAQPSIFESQKKFMLGEGNHRHPKRIPIFLSGISGRTENGRSATP